MSEHSENSNEEITLNLSFLKKFNWVFIFLTLFLIFGVYIRLYHIDFPSIGYHNMKENENLDEAYLFMQRGDLLHREAFAFYGLDEKGGYFEEYGQAPLVPYLIAILWNIFGEHLQIARLLIICFFMGCMFATYFVMKRLSKNEYLALLSAGLITVMPLGIYFGRNVQPDSPALLFSLLFLYYFLKWIDEQKSKDMLYAALYIGIAGLFKYTFLIFGFLFLWLFPYKMFYNKFIKHRKQALQDILYGVYGLIPFIIGFLIYEFFAFVDISKKRYNLDLFMIFKEGYWPQRTQVLMSFLRDNYTMWFVAFAIGGLLFALLKYKTRLGKFIVGYSIMIIPYLMLTAEKIAGHSYYQMPFLPLICIASAYFLYVLGTICQSIIKNKFIVFLPLILIIFAVPSMQAANDRVFGTVFYGQDFLGEYLKTRMQPEERLVAFSHSQDVATCSYAKHKCGSTDTLDEFKEKDKIFGLNYIYMGTTTFYLLMSQDPMWAYIKDNYRIDLVGLMNVNGQLTPTHFILKKGGKFNLKDIENKQPQLAKTYDMKFGQVPYYFIQNI